MSTRKKVPGRLYRLRSPGWGVKTEKVPQLPSKALFSKRFEDAVGESCESAAAGRVAKQFRLAASTVWLIDLRYLERWAAKRGKLALWQLRVDEIRVGKEEKFLTVARKPESGRCLPAGEGTFLACTFWLVDVYVLRGRQKEVQAFLRS